MWLSTSAELVLQSSPNAWPTPPENGREDVARANPGKGDACCPTGSQVHLILFVLLEAVITFIVSLYIILLFF